MRVLVIDDDDIARELLSSTLEDDGHDVFELPSAIGASREIYRNEIDAVVLDVMMPDINGDKLAKLLRNNTKGKSLAIILVSSRPIEELQVLASLATADAVVAKERIRMDLTRAVNRACQVRGLNNLAS
jgi:DNA-binding response OmpR family regulator